MRKASNFLVVTLCTCLIVPFVTGCTRPAPPSPQGAAPAEKIEPTAAPVPGLPTTASPVQAEQPRQLQWVDAPPDIAVDRLVRAQLRKAQAQGQTLLVYAGATWCEPCRYFHDAAAAGKLDGRLGRLRIFAFDMDRDRDRLAAAGYQSQMIPLFAVPNADGRASGRQVGGAIKGPEAVDFLVPKLEDLLTVTGPGRGGQP